MQLKWIGWAALVAAVSACATDDGEGPEMMEECQLEPTFGSLHSQLFSTTTCALSSCHGSRGASVANGLDMTTGRDDVYLALTSSTTDTVGSQTFPRRVVPGSPETSYLHHLVTSTNPDERMPLGGQLDDCQIQAIRDWISNGAQNDG